MTHLFYTLPPLLSLFQRSAELRAVRQILELIDLVDQLLQALGHLLG
jgi:hypothetical protein